MLRLLLLVDNLLGLFAELRLKSDLLLLFIVLLQAIFFDFSLRLGIIILLIRYELFQGSSAFWRTYVLSKGELAPALRRTLAFVGRHQMRSECGILFKFFPFDDNLFVLLPSNLLLLLLLILQLLHHKFVIFPLRQHSRRLLSFLRVSAARLSSGSDLRASAHLTSRRCFLRHPTTTTQALTYLIDWASCRHNITGLVSKPASRD